MGPADALPDRFGQVRLLGRGAQGQTYAAHDRKLDRAVAVKVFSLRDRDGWKGFELFERECAALRTIDHPGVPAYYEHLGDADTGRYYLVMALIDGRALSVDLAEGRRRTEDELLALLQRALDIVEHLHALRPPVIHRDIKPGNLIVGPDGRVTLVDFGGVTKAFGEKGGSTMIGTFGYMAPEQLYGEAGPATDLYALGATFCALAGGVEAEDLPRKGMDIDVAALVQPGPLRRVLQAMCRADVDRRASSVAQVRQALAEPPARPRSASAALAQVAAHTAVAESPGLFTITRLMTNAQKRTFYGGSAVALVAGSAVFNSAIGLLAVIGFAAAYIVWVAAVRGYHGAAED